MNLIRKRIKRATQAYDKLFHAVEKYVCEDMGVNNLSEMMAKLTQKTLETTNSTDKKEILWDVMCASGDYLAGIGIAAVKDDKECSEILAYMDDPIEFMHGVEAQVQVKAHQPENMKASEELVDKYIKNR